MSVNVEICVNEKAIAKLSMHNITPGGEPAEAYKYAYAMCETGKRTCHSGKVTHDYNDGIYALIVTVLDQILVKAPKLRSSGKRRCRVACEHCGEVLESIYRHDYRQCSCGNTMLDGGQDGGYVRYGGCPVRPPRDSVVERRLKRLGQDGVKVTYSRKNGFSLAWGSPDLVPSEKVRHNGLEVRGRALQPLLDEAIKRNP